MCPEIINPACVSAQYRTGIFSNESNPLVDYRWTRSGVGSQGERVGADPTGPSHGCPVCCNLQRSGLQSPRQGSLQIPNHEREWNQVNCQLENHSLQIPAIKMTWKDFPKDRRPRGTILTPEVLDWHVQQPHGCCIWVSICFCCESPKGRTDMNIAVTFFFLLWKPAVLNLAKGGHCSSNDHVQYVCGDGRRCSTHEKMQYTAHSHIQHGKRDQGEFYRRTPSSWESVFPSGDFPWDVDETHLCSPIRIKDTFNKFSFLFMVKKKSSEVQSLTNCKMSALCSFMEVVWVSHRMSLTLTHDVNESAASFMWRTCSVWSVL